MPIQVIRGWRDLPADQRGAAVAIGAFDGAFAAAARFAEAGAIVEEAHPDFSEAHESFNTLRAKGFAISKKALLDTAMTT